MESSQSLTRVHAGTAKDQGNDACVGDSGGPLVSLRLGVQVGTAQLYSSRLPSACAIRCCSGQGGNGGAVLLASVAVALLPGTGPFSAAVTRSSYCGLLKPPLYVPGPFSCSVFIQLNALESRPLLLPLCRRWGQFRLGPAPHAVTRGT